MTEYYAPSIRNQRTNPNLRVPNGCSEVYVKELVVEALPSAVADLTRKKCITIEISAKKLPEGSAKDYVAIVDVTARLRLIVMVDSTHNLPSELAKRGDLPNIVLDHIPSLYFCRVERDKVAVVEEYVGKTITQMIQDRKADPLQLLNKVLRESNSFYTSTRVNSIVDLENLYLGWIFRRTKDTTRYDPIFAQMLMHEIAINGKRFLPLHTYLTKLKEKLPEMQPGFETFLHGDWWASNWSIHPLSRCLYILDPDPYHKPRGDYLYDQAKVAWYLQTTTNGFDAIPTDPFINHSRAKLEVEITGGCEEFNVCYNHHQPPWTKEALRTLYNNTENLATMLRDRKWKPRFELAQGATCIGLTRKAILRYNDHKCAVFLYAIGLNHLEQCLKNLEVSRNE